MPTWGELLRELTEQAQATGTIPLDEMRRRALASLHQITGRPLVVYASRWVQGGGNPQDTSIAIADLHALMEVLHGITGPNLDIILHSSGGSPMAAEAIVNYIRTKFSHVRAIVPLAAMSAATMMACAANSIVLGKHSFLGPVDPQLILETPLGVQQVPAQAIRDQFKLAEGAAAVPARFPAWLPMIQQYGPALLVQCDNVLKLSEKLVTDWLEKWMFAGHANARASAESAARYLNEHGTHLVHGRFLSRETVRGFGLVVEDLESDQTFQDAVLTVLHTFTHTFQFNGMLNKIVENHLGRAFMTMQPQPVAPRPNPPPSSSGPPPSPPM